MPPRAARSAERATTRREELLAALIDVFFGEGFAHLSVEDLARRLGCSKSTLYVVATSKEQIVVAVVRAVFRRSTDRVEARVAREPDPVARIGVYLEAIATELSPASPAYFADLEAHAPAHEVYRQNTAIAAARVQELLREAGADAVDPTFVGTVAGLVMEAIQRRRIEAATGLGDAEAFHALAQLITAGIAGPSERTP
ncbi:TetR/AcrR family transcriptional regulator [Aeromicrobium sp. CF4.19]|uniref:TetR/AcrR family transcriptional regulator n=1 Tax=Aeromicrobium sp. CF4.19 TaxID=3373082 RepID=UPI003EE455B9